MWATRYFTPRYWAERYWVKTGSDFIHVIAPTVFQAPRRRTALAAPERRYLSGPRRWNL
jgi:hypothetical protein